MSDTTDHDQYAVFGNPITHSKSPLLHSAFAKQTHQSLIYNAQCIALDQFAHEANRFFQSGGKGLNVTVPFKEEAFQLADQLSAEATIAGAVNTLISQGDGTILGDNTDGKGMVKDIKQHLTWPIKNKRVLLLGAGGAIKGVLHPLIMEQPHSIVIANRTASKAVALANHFSEYFSAIEGIGLSSIGDASFDIIINGTSASLSGDLPDIPSSIFTGNSCCYDMMYSKDLTPFLLWCQQNGVSHLSDGLGMLVCQGAESFFLWRGIRPETQPVITQLRQHL